MSKLERLIEYELGINDWRAIRSPDRYDSLSRYLRNIIFKNLFNITEVAPSLITGYAISQGDYVIVAAGFACIGTSEVAKSFFTSTTKYPIDK